MKGLGGNPLFHAQPTSLPGSRLTPVQGASLWKCTGFVLKFCHWQRMIVA